MDPRSPLYVNWQSPVRWEQPLNRGLVAWWKAVPHWKGGTVFRDLCGRNHGTLTNMDPATDWVTQTHRGGWGALDFDGSDDRVLCGEPLALGTGDFSLTAIGLCRTTPGGTSAAAFIGRGNTPVTRLANLEVVPAASPDAGKAQFQIFDGTNNPFARTGSVITGVGYVHLVGVRRSGTIYIYLNGVFQNSATDTASDVGGGSGSEWVLGRRLDGSTLDGQIDSTRIYNRALSAFEVQALYLDELDYCRETLRRWWVGSMKAPAAANVYGTVFQSPVVRSTPRYAM